MGMFENIQFSKKLNKKKSFTLSIYEIHKRTTKTLRTVT